MEAKDFYNKEMKQNPIIGTVELMEKFARHIIEQNFCNGSPMDFDELNISQLREMNDRVSELVIWVNK